MTFHVGQKVVCITPAGGYQYAPGSIEPDKDDIGTITNVYVSRSGEQTLELAEFPTTPGFGYEPGWVAEDFRPIVERKTDISIFKEMLTPQGVDA